MKIKQTKLEFSKSSIIELNDVKLKNIKGGTGDFTTIGPTSFTGITSISGVTITNPYQPRY